MAKHQPVLIAGGGIGGLTAAIALAPAELDDEPVVADPPELPRFLLTRPSCPRWARPPRTPSTGTWGTATRGAGNGTMGHMADKQREGAPRFLTLADVAEEIKITAFRVTRVGELIGRELAARLGDADGAEALAGADAGEAVVERLRAAVESTGATGFGAFAGLHPLGDGRLLWELTNDHPEITYLELGKKTPWRFWLGLARVLRFTTDYVRYLTPEYADATALRDRAGLRIPRAVRLFFRLPFFQTRMGGVAAAATLRTIRRALPPARSIRAIASAERGCWSPSCRMLSARAPTAPRQGIRRSSGTASSPAGLFSTIRY